MSTKNHTSLEDNFDEKKHLKYIYSKIYLRYIHFEITKEIICKINLNAESILSAFDKR